MSKVALIELAHRLMNCEEKYRNPIFCFTRNGTAPEV